WEGARSGGGRKYGRFAISSAGTPGAGSVAKTQPVMIPVCTITLTALNAATAAADLRAYVLSHKRIICPYPLGGRRREHHAPPGSRLLQVPLAKQLRVMQLVARDDVEERAHAHRIVVRRAAARERLRLEVRHQLHRRRAHRAKLLGKIGQRAPPEVAGRHPRVLVESRKRRRVIPREGERAVSHHPLDVGQSEER